MNWISRLIYSYMQHFDKETPVQLRPLIEIDFLLVLMNAQHKIQIVKGL